MDAISDKAGTCLQTTAPTPIRLTVTLNFPFLFAKIY